jgi:hypothetical protein
MPGLNVAPIRLAYIRTSGYDDGAQRLVAYQGKERGVEN